MSGMKKVSYFFDEVKEILGRNKHGIEEFELAKILKETPEFMYKALDYLASQNLLDVEISGNKRTWKLK